MPPPRRKELQHRPVSQFRRTRADRRKTPAYRGGVEEGLPPDREGSEIAMGYTSGGYTSGGYTSGGNTSGGHTSGISTTASYITSDCTCDFNFQPEESDQESGSGEEAGPRVKRLPV